jgi:hypothetical protein
MKACLSVMSALLLAAAAAGQSWVEDGDAPELLPGQTTIGTGPLTSISGRLSSGSDVDLYAIYISEPENFSAQTCGGTSLDSCLYLFDQNGNGVSMSEDGCGIQSWITQQFVTSPGLYYVAMSVYDYDPLNPAGLEIWNDTPWSVERQPDGPGAPGPLAAWGGGGGGSGNYFIYLTGCTYAEQGPPPQTGACCFIDGSCQVTTASGCASQGGTYQGDGVPCTPNPCPPPPTGACCFGTGACLEITATLCLSNGGTFNGEGSICWPNPCVSVPVEWTDNFDSYDNGTVLFDIGGWSGWDHNPEAAGVVTNEQARSAPHSIRVKNPVDAVHPFSGIEGGQWRIIAWQYIPSGLSGSTYFIVNSYYQHGGPYFWTVQLRFDPSTNEVYDDLRAPSGPGLPIVYDQWVEIRIDVDFEAGPLGTVWEYYNGQLLLSGNWITGSVGQLAIGNIDLYGPQETGVYYDDLEVKPLAPPPAATRPLFAGVQYGGLPTRTTDLSGFPNVTWLSGFVFGVNGAAARPDGAIYISSGDFNTKLYLAAPEGPPIYLCDVEEDVSGLAYGRGRLFGFCNYASPMGIYEINPATGSVSLVVNTAGPGYRYFGLDYNSADGKLYGYTGYGTPTGLHAIDIDTGQVTPVAGPVPTANSAVDALACGYNKVYAVTVYGNAGYPMFVYDLAQGPGGTWVPMTHPFPESQSASGAAFAPGPVPGDLNCDGQVNAFDIDPFVLALSDPDGYRAAYPDCIIYNADANLDGQVNAFDIDAFVELLTGKK